jgi:cytoskeletal protein RodZ
MLADVPLALPTSLDKATRQAISGISAVIAATLLVLIGIVIWIVFFRKPARRRERNMLVEGEVSRQSGSGRRRRRRRDSHRPTNPTLAQTGGLPPRGAGDSKPPNS